jgi:hypothetical protein
MTPDERENLRQRVFSGDKVDEEALRKLAEDYREEAREKDLGKAIELWMAEWRSYPQADKAEIMSWYWRRPPKPGRKKGRLFTSTDQAYRALRKEKGLPLPDE